MRNHTWGIIASVVLAFFFVAVSAATAQAATCQFTGGFRTLHDQMPNVVGNCVDNEYYNANGNGYQHTTGPTGKGGLLVWAKADNRVSFTDGFRTWVAGPYGIEERLNTQRFPWELSAEAAHSRNWAGYMATNGMYRSVRGTWVVPALGASGTGGVVGMWVGIGGVTSSDLIQAGTNEEVTASGRLLANAWIETLPQAARTIPLAVSPGNSVTASVSLQSAGRWLVRVTNNTTGRSYQQIISYNSLQSSAEWIVEAPVIGRQLLPLANFGTVYFGGSTAVRNGSSLTIAQADGTPVDLVDRFGQILAAPSALGSDGASFGVTRIVPVTPLPPRAVPVPGLEPLPLS